jgi:hypothetical protein
VPGQQSFRPAQSPGHELFVQATEREEKRVLNREMFWKDAMTKSSVASCGVD